MQGVLPQFFVAPVHIDDLLIDANNFIKADLYESRCMYTVILLV